MTVFLLGAGVAVVRYARVVEIPSSMFGGQVSRNMVNLLGQGAPDDWAIEKNGQEARSIQWVQALGSRSYGGPVIAGGRIFIGTNNAAPRDPKIQGDKGVLMCFRQSDGEFLWQAAHPKLPNQEHDWPQQGIISHPAVEGDRLWYVSNRCELICANVADGSPVWRLDMFKELGVRPHGTWAGASGCSPLIAGDLVFVVTGNGVDLSHLRIPAPQAPSFLAVDKHTGEIIWQDNTPTAKAVGTIPATMKRLMDTGQVVAHGQWSNPTYAVVRGRPQVIFPGGDGWLRAFEPRTGKLIWKFDANPKEYLHWMSMGPRGSRNSFTATPVVVGERLYIGTGEDPEQYDGVAHFWCLDITRTGDISPELVVDDSVYPPKTRPNPNTGAVWVHGGLTSARDVLGRGYPFGRTMSTAAVHDGLVYVAELAGIMHCLDAATGKLLWQHDLKSAVHGSPYWVDGKVYVGTEDGEVWIFEHGPACKLIRKIEMGNVIRSNPIVIDRALYIATDSHLYAIAP